METGHCAVVFSLNNHRCSGTFHTANRGQIVKLVWYTCKVNLHSKSDAPVGHCFTGKRDTGTTQFLRSSYSHSHYHHYEQIWALSNINTKASLVPSPADVTMNMKKSFHPPAPSQSVSASFSFSRVVSCFASTAWWCEYYLVLTVNIVSSFARDVSNVFSPKEKLE